jgi:hypothetical protein
MNGRFARTRQSTKGRFEPLERMSECGHEPIVSHSGTNCSSCALKTRCCPNTPMRKIARSVHESAREVARDVAKTDGYKQSRKDRKKVEMLFAHLKRILELDRLRLRGPSGAQDEFLLAAIAQNRRRMAKRLMFAAPEAVPIAA